MVFRLLDTANAYGSEAGGWTSADRQQSNGVDRIQALSPVFDELATTSEPLRESGFSGIPCGRAFKVLIEEADPEIRKNSAAAQM